MTRAQEEDNYECERFGFAHAHFCDPCACQTCMPYDLFFLSYQCDPYSPIIAANRINFHLLLTCQYKLTLPLPPPPSSPSEEILVSVEDINRESARIAAAPLAGQETKAGKVAHASGEQEKKASNTTQGASTKRHVAEASYIAPPASLPIVAPIASTTSRQLPGPSSSPSCRSDVQGQDDCVVVDGAMGRSRGQRANSVKEGQMQMIDLYDDDQHENSQRKKK